MSLRLLILLLAVLTQWAEARDALPVLRAGDVLELYLPGEAELSGRFQLDDRGQIKLPEVGDLTLAGLPLAQARLLVHEKLATVFRNIDRLGIQLKERRLLIHVLGYVEKPGAVDLPDHSGVQQALAAAGGLKAGAQLDRLQLQRNGQKNHFDYKAYLDSGDLGLLPELHPLDTLFVPASPLLGNVQVTFDTNTLKSSGDAGEDHSSIKVFGEVNRSGRFSFKAGSSVIDYLMRAGGVTRYGGVDQIRIITHGQPVIFNLTAYLESGQDSDLPPLQAGATLFVPMKAEQIKTNSRTVYIMGEVFKPGAYESQPGTGFMDILANAGGPTRFAESRQIRVLRGNGEVESFDLQAYTEGLKATLPPLINPGDAIFVPEKTDLNEKSWLKIAPSRAVRIIGSVNRPGRYEWADEMSLLDLIAHAQGPSAKADTVHIMIHNPASSKQPGTRIFDLDSYLKDSSHTGLPWIGAGSTVMFPELPQDPSDNKARWVRQPAENSLYIFGAINAPGRYLFNDQMGFLDILSAADGPSAGADLHHISINHRGENQVRTSELNLSLYFATGDDSLLPDIKRGDTIYIPQREKQWLDTAPEDSIRVLGAVKNPGRYSFADNMDILDLLAEAGGTSSSARLSDIIVVHRSCCAEDSVTFDLMRWAKTGDSRTLPVLRAGDSVLVPDTNSSLWRQVVDRASDVFKVLSPLLLLGII